MTEKTKKIVKWCGVGAIALGSVALYLGGGSEGYGIEVVGGVFLIIGIVIGILKK